MKEYIFYTSLVFLPIAGVMFYILRSYRLSFSAIWSILVLTFIIIITFPVSVAKIGTIFSLVVYLIVLGGLALYLLQYDDYSLETGTDMLERSEEFSPVRGEKGQELWVQKTWPGMDDGDSMNANREPDAENMLHVKEAIAEESLPELEDKGERKAEILLVSEKEAVDENKDVLPYEAGGEDEEAAGEEKTIQELEMEYNGEKADEGCEEAAACMESIEEKAESREENSAVIEDEAKEAACDNRDKVEEEAEERKVVRLLDLAFAARMKDDLEGAFAYFKKAWELTRDIDLKYMLALELAEISIVLGWYSQGEEIIVKCMNEYMLNEMMQRELARKLAFIQLIRREIRHLKLEEVPFARLPRLLKMKVEDELRRLYL